MLSWLFGRKRREEELLANLVRAAAEGHQLSQLQRSIATISSDRLNGKDATEISAIAAVVLTNAIVDAAISVIDDDDDIFVAGIFSFVFANHFSYVTAGNFELSSTLAVQRLLGNEEFKRSFNTIMNSYNNMTRSNSKVLEAIGKTCDVWLKNSTPQQFEKLVELFKLLRQHTVIK